MSQSHVQDHVELIAKHELDFLTNRTQPERITDAVGGFIGSLKFVLMHLFLFAVWIVWNVMPQTQHFDPRPFGLLQTCVAMESILAASFILMRQARLSRRSDERDHLMMQVLLLTEKELTAMLGLNREIATEVGLQAAANTTEMLEMSKHTKIDEVAESIKENLSGE